MPTSKRELIAPRGDKRYIRRDEKGRVKESDDFGRLLTTDRRQRAKTAAKLGQGNRAIVVARAVDHSMSKLTWSEFIHLHPVAHLLIGVAPEGDMIESSRPQINLMARLLLRMAGGHHASMVSRRSHTFEIHCAFEREADAKKLGDALGTYQCIGYPTGASQRWFKLDGAALDILDVA